MPRTLARLQHKRPQGKATTGPTSKQPGQNQQPSQFTNFQSVRSAVTSDDLISRLADTVTQCRRQENRPSLTARQSADTPVMEIPATLPSTPPCLLSHSLPALEGVMQASHLATEPAVSPGGTLDPFMSSSLPLDIHISEKIRTKIWNQENVDPRNNNPVNKQPVCQR